MKKMERSFLASILILIASCSLSQTQPSTPPQGVVIHAGKLLNVRTGKTISDAIILVEADKIAYAGAASSAPATSDRKVIHLPNATILPGLIDAHTHITSNPSFGYEQLAISTPRAMRGSRWRRGSQPCGTWARMAIAT